MNENKRNNYQQLDDVCMDCCDFIKKAYVECENCPIKKLKLQLLKESKNEHTK